MSSKSNLLLDLKYSKSIIMQRLEDAHLYKNPYPHSYIENFLPETLRSGLRKCFEDLTFVKHFQGAVPVHHIDEKSPSLLHLFRDEIVDEVMTPHFSMMFQEFELEKLSQLEKDSPNILKSSSPDYVSIYLAKNPVGGTIPVHLDDYWASFQFVFYLGDSNGNSAPTTDLVNMNAGALIEDYNLSNAMTVTNYGSTSNGLLAFVNSPKSLHALLDPLKDERWSICISAHFYRPSQA